MTTFCVMFVHKTGGSKSVVGPTAAEAEAAADKLMKGWPTSFVARSPPYEVGESCLYRGVLCTSPPESVRALWRKQTTSTAKGMVTVDALYGAKD